MAAKTFDIVVFGATGFTGTLVARYLAEEAESALGATGALKWAIAGRSEAKLQQTKQTLKEKAPGVSPELIDALPTIVADSADESSLVAMVRQTKVVLSLVGPYKLYGSLLVKACAENGVHYCDLTGELVWVNEMIAAHQATAEKTGAILVNCCGYESIPSDLATLLVADRIKEKTGMKTARVDAYLTDFSGAVSGGTFASMFAMMETSTSKQLAESQSPFFLTDKATIARKEAEGLVKPNSTSMAVKYDKQLRLWSAVWLGGGVNQTIVHRSNYLLREKYGNKLVFSERLAKGGLFMQVLITVGSAALGMLLFFGWTRALIKKLAPAPGQGPSEEVMRNGLIEVTTAGYSEDGKLAVTGKVSGAGDPGYWLTSRMISEAAFCLARGEVNADCVKTGGFFTPAAALGRSLADRLQRKRILVVELADASA